MIPALEQAMVRNGRQPKSFIFECFELDDEKRLLMRDGVEVHLAKTPFDVLWYLIENRDRVVSRDELLDAFWDGKDVYDDSLRKCVGTIRHALNDTQRPQRLIETRYGGGYRFIGEAQVSTANGVPAESGTQRTQVPVLDAVAETDSVPGVKLYPFIIGAAATLLVLLSMGSYVFWSKNAGTSSQPTQISNIHSVAILPLDNLSGDPANEYFSDGITDSLISEMSRMGGLRVISRSSTFALKGKRISSEEIGRKLSVDAFLEGSLKKEGDSFTVDVRLIGTKDGSILWSSPTYRRLSAGAYELHRAMACDLANSIRAGSCEATAPQYTENSDAYLAYLRGRYQWNKRTADGIRNSIEEYNRSIRFDPAYALAYAGLAESYVQGIWHVPFDPDEILPKAEAAALRALELDEGLAEAHTALAGVYGLQWRWAEEERELHRSLEINPRFARAYHAQAFYFVTMGRHQEAIAAIRQALELDPLNLVINTDLGVILSNAGRHDEAFKQWEKTLEMDPNFEMVFVHRFIAYAALGQVRPATDAWLRFMELQGRSVMEISAMRRAAERDGLAGIYRRELADHRSKEKLGQRIPNMYLAMLCAQLGEKDEAFRYLEKGWSRRDSEMVLIKSDQRLASLRDDARYRNLLDRMGLPPES